MYVYAYIPCAIQSVVIVASFVIRVIIDIFGVVVMVVIVTVVVVVVSVVGKALVCARADIDLLVDVLTIIGVRADMVIDSMTDVMIGGGVGMVADVEIIVVAAAVVAL